MVCNVEIQKFHKKKDVYFPLIDIIKLFCAFLVVIIHSGGIVSNNSLNDFIIKCFTGQAVPFFMIVSGYFSVYKLSQLDNKNLIKVCFKNWIYLYIVWSVIWFPYYIITYRMLYPRQTFGYIFILIIRRYIFAGHGVYWYLLALAESVFLSAILVRKNHEKTLLGIAILGLLWGFVYDANVIFPDITVINKLIYVVFSWSNNFIMKGIPYVAIGYFTKKYALQYKVGIKKSVSIYVFSSIIMMILYMVGKYNLLILYPLQAFSLFLIALYKPHKHIETRVTKTCRNLSSSIYFLHTLFIYIVFNLILHSNIPMFLRFMIPIIISILIYIFVEKKNIMKMKWLLGIK